MQTCWTQGHGALGACRRWRCWRSAHVWRACTLGWQEGGWETFDDGGCVGGVGGGSLVEVTDNQNSQCGIYGVPVRDSVFKQSAEGEREKGEAPLLHPSLRNTQIELLYKQSEPELRLAAVPL